MVVSVKHSTVATYPDEEGAEINKAEWNDDHVIDTTGASNGDVLTVVAGEAEWATPTTPDLTPYAKLDGTNQPFTALGMVMTTSTLTGSQTAFPAGLIKWNGASTCTIMGIPAPSTSIFCIIQNATTNQIIQIAHQNATATAANRIITMSGGTMNVNAGQSAQLYYDTVTGRWRLHNIGFINSVSSPFVVSAGNLTMPQATSGVSGYLAGGDWTVFNSKVGGTGAINSIPYWSATTTLTHDGYFGFDPTTNSLGVGVANGAQEATGHFKSDVAESLAAVSSASANLVQFYLPNAPSNVSYTQVTPDIAQASVGGSTSNIGSGNYSAGDVVDYVTRAGYDDGFGTIYWSVATGDLYGVTDGSNSFDVDISISAVSGQNFTPNVWSISRQINSAGFNDYQRFYSSSFTDNNSGWIGGADSFSTYADDFLANGTSYNNNFYGTLTSPISTVIVSGAYNANFNDSASQNAYKLQIDITGGDASPTYRIDWNGTNNYSTASTSFTLAPSMLSSGAPTTSPTTYGYNADGSNLNNNYEVYNRQSAPTLYSSSVNVSTTDPSDGNYYYVDLTFSSSTGLAKIVKNSAVGKNVSGTIYDDNVTPFTDGTTVTPTSLYRASGLFESHGTSSSESATVVLRSLDGDYTRIDFENSSSTRQGYIEHSVSTLSLNFPNINYPNQTASTIAGFDSSKNLISLPTSTYPSLTEFSYVKGVTSAIQTQLNAKQASDSDLTALANNTTNGLWARTSTGAGSARTITGTTNQVTVTNGDGVSGNPTLSLPQDIHTGATPTFASVTASGNNGFLNSTSVVNVGNANTVSAGTNRITVGISNSATVNGATSIGRNNVSSGNGASSIGFGNGGGVGTAIGSGNSIFGASSTFATGSIGYGNQASDNFAISLGTSNISVGQNATSIGSLCDARGVAAVAMGLYAFARYDQAVAIGIGTDANATNAAIFGHAPNTYSVINSTPDTLMVAYEGTNFLLDANKITANKPLVFKDYTVATLPTGVNYMRAFVSDALAPVFGAAVVGGGAVKIPVYYDGTWRVG